jgi:comEA protein
MLDLTRQEKRVLVFLASLLALGISILYVKDLLIRPKIEVFSSGEEIDMPQEKTININTATKGDIVRLKGIGPALAESIIQYRAQHGGFRDKEELKAVKGIGQAKYDGIKDHIKTE